MYRILLITATILLLSGCTFHQYVYEPEELLATLEPRLSQHEFKAVEIPFEATDDMAEFARKATRGDINSVDKCVHLVNAIMSDWTLDVGYDRTADFTAEQVFHDTRRANCLAFTHLFVSLARSLDVNAHYVDVKFEDQIARDGRIISSHHICAGVYDGADFFLIDFDPSPEKNYRVYRLLDDLEALTNHYNNIAMNEYFLGQKNSEKALILLNTALKITPDSTRALNNHGVVLSVLGKQEAAKKSLRAALVHDPTMPEANSNLAGILLEEGDFDSALLHINRAVNENPSNTHYRFRLAMAQLHMGDYPRAIRNFRKVVRAEPDNHSAHHGYALASYQLGKLKDAHVSVVRALELDPDMLDALRLKRVIDTRIID